MDHHVFISYAREDAGIASRLRDSLESKGVSTWMDTDKVAAGDRFTAEIDAAIESASVLVVVVSEASKASVWVTREALAALQLEKRVIPVLVEAVALPTLLTDRNAVDLHKDFHAGLARLLLAVRDEIGTRPTRPAAEMRETGGPSVAAKALWLVAGAGVFVVLSVLAVRSEGRVAEVLAAALAIGGALLALAWKADDGISPQFRRDLSLWLVRMDTAAVGRSVQRWPVYFAALFDRVFGKKHLGWRCLFRSCIASLLAFLACTVVFIQAAPGAWSAFSTGAMEAYGPLGAGGHLAVLGVTAATVNLIPDYVSLLETRYIIQRMQRAETLAGQFIWLVVDFAATTAVLVLVLAVLTPLVSKTGFGLTEFERLFVSLGFSSWHEQVTRAFERVVAAALLWPSGDPARRFIAIPIWTTYLTSLWVWLYFLAQFVTRLASPLRGSLGFLQYALPVEQRPMRAVGQVMALVALSAYCAVMLLVPGFHDDLLTDRPLPEMMSVPGGNFRMGSPETEDGRYDYEGPVRVVQVAPFAIGRYEVTFDEYEAYTRATGRALLDDKGWGRGRQPVINVSWSDAVAYATWLSKETGRSCRLPSEAEWEYAARAGTETRWPFGDDEAELSEHAWYRGNAERRAHEVGTRDANPWGLHDMHGNVWEWVQDRWRDSYNGAPGDGSAREAGSASERAVRGGSWLSGPRNTRSASRFGYSPGYRHHHIGFRVLCSPPVS